MGGRYQITQVYFSGHGTLTSKGADEPAGSSRGVDSGSFRALFIIFPIGFSLLSVGVGGAPPPKVADLKSKAVPGVLGVLFAEPKEAKAPDPRPKAVEPAMVGEASPPAVMGERALKGLRPPWADVSPKRFVAEKERWGGSGFPSPLGVESESLLVLLACVSCEGPWRGLRGAQTWNVESIGCPWCPLAITYTITGAIRGADGRCRELGGIKERTSNRGGGPAAREAQAAGEELERARAGRVRWRLAGEFRLRGITTGVYRREIGRMASWRGVNVLCSET